MLSTIFEFYLTINKLSSISTINIINLLCSYYVHAGQQNELMKFNSLNTLRYRFNTFRIYELNTFLFIHK